MLAATITCGVFGAVPLQAASDDAAKKEPAAPAASSHLVTPETADPRQAMSKAEFVEIMRQLKKRFADNEMVQTKGLGSEALPEVLDKLGGVAVLSAQKLPARGQAEMIYTELLPYRIGYWRLESFRPRSNWEALRNQLLLWQRSGVIGVVLDVRDFQDVNDYAGAAELASLFIPGGRMLFSTQGLQISQTIYRTESEAAPYTGPVVVLTNHRTAGAAEALAAALRNQVGAVLLGRSTAGQGAVWTETQLGSGRYLRLAAGEATLEDGTPLFAKNQTPDIPLYIDEPVEQAALKLIAQGQARKLVRERPTRRRMSEAALVRRENPELDAAIDDRKREQNGADAESDKGDELPRDIALIRALDVLRAIDATRPQAATGIR